MSLPVAVNNYEKNAERNVRLKIFYWKCAKNYNSGNSGKYVSPILPAPCMLSVCVGFCFFTTFSSRGSLFGLNDRLGRAKMILKWKINIILISKSVWRTKRCCFRYALELQMQNGFTARFASKTTPLIYFLRFIGAQGHESFLEGRKRSKAVLFWGK